MLSLGEYGWIQVINFVTAGVLSLIFAVGVAHRLQDGPGSTWVPRLLALFGVGLVLGGIFKPDAALGFPAGAPEGYPVELSVHGTIHAVAPPLSFLSVVAAFFIMARRFAAKGMRRAAVLTRVAAVACLVLSVPIGPGASIRLFPAVTLAFGWLTAYAVYVRRR